MIVQLGKFLAFISSNIFSHAHLSPLSPGDSNCAYIGKLGAATIQQCTEVLFFFVLLFPLSVVHAWLPFLHLPS